MAIITTSSGLGHEILQLMKKMYGDGRAFAHIVPNAYGSADPSAVTPYDKGGPPYRFGWKDPVSGDGHTWYGNSWEDAWESYLKTTSAVEVGPWVNCNGQAFVDVSYTVPATVQYSSYLPTPAQNPVVFLDKPFTAFDAVPDNVYVDDPKYKVEELLGTIGAALKSQPDPDVFSIPGSGAIPPAGFPKFAPDPDAYSSQQYTFKTEYKADPATGTFKYNTVKVPKSIPIISEIISEARQDEYISMSVRRMKARGEGNNVVYSLLTQQLDYRRQNFVMKLTQAGVSGGSINHILQQFDVQASKIHLKLTHAGQLAGDALETTAKVHDALHPTFTLVPPVPVPPFMYSFGKMNECEQAYSHGPHRTVPCKCGYWRPPYAPTSGVTTGHTGELVPVSEAVKDESGGDAMK